MRDEYKFGPFEVKARTADAFGESQIYWYVDGPVESGGYHGGYLNSYANLAPLEDDPAHEGRNLPPPAWVYNVARLMYEAYEAGQAARLKEIKAALCI